jgi:uncharacterized protein YijF (DUF1287 family)
MLKTRRFNQLSSFLLRIVLCFIFYFHTCAQTAKTRYHEANLKIYPTEVGKIVKAALSQVGQTLDYDPRYVRISYPNGDVSLKTGVCTDVVIRALRAVSIDLQKEIHEDMKDHFKEYPKKWGLKKADSNIDHRRVPNQQVYFKRKGWSQPISQKAEDYQPGDIVAWKLNSGRDHIGVLSHRKTSGGRLLVVHNIGFGAQVEDVLFHWKITGHFRQPRR